MSQHEVRFIWPHPEPKTVIVTGTFDQWSASTPLTKTPTGFEGTTKVPWGQKIKYKFVVDGEWITHEDQPTEIDPGGFVNNVYTAPPDPAGPEPAPATEAPAVVEPVAVETSVKDTKSVANGHATNGHGAAPEAVEGEPASESAEGQEDEVKPPAAGPIKGEDTTAAPSTEPEESYTYPAGYPRLLADLAETIVARDGTSSALSYVASGLGAAMHSVVGVDPINIQKIAIPTPKPGDAFTLPGGQESVPNTADLPPKLPTAATDSTTPESLPSPVAPIVPIMIVPVNAPENNTAAPAETPTVANPSEGATDETAKEGESSTHAPVVVNTEDSASAAGDKISNEVPVPGIHALAVEYPAEEVKAEEPPAPAPVAEEPAHEVKAEGPSAPEPSPAPAVEPTPAPAVEEPAAEEATPVPAVEESSAPAPTPATEEPSVEPTPASAAEEPSAPDPTPAPAVGKPATEVEPAVPAPTPVPVAKEPSAPESTPAPAAEEPAAEVKAEEPSVFEPAPTLAEPAAEEKVEESSAPEPAPTVEEPAAEEKAEEPSVPEPPSTLVAGEPVSELEAEESSAPVAKVKAEESTTPKPEPKKEEAAAVEEPAVKPEETPAPEPTPVVEPAASEPEPTVEPASAPALEHVEEVAEMKEAPSTPAVAAESAPDVNAEVAPAVVTQSEKAVSSGQKDAVEAPVESTPVTSPVPPVEEKAAEAEPPAPIDAPETAPAITGLPTPEPVPEVTKGENVESTPTSTAEGKKPATNGDSAPPGPAATAPATPTKNGQTFPMDDSSVNSSPSSSKFNSVRKKRTSIFGKLKHIFHHDKEKEKEKEKK